MAVSLKNIKGIQFEGGVTLRKQPNGPNLEIIGGGLNTDVDLQGFAGGEITVNEAGLDVDFRIEGDTEANLFQVDASIDGLGFFGATPVNQPGATEDLKDVLVSLGFIVDSGASPLDLDGGAATLGTTIVESGGLTVQDGASAMTDNAAVPLVLTNATTGTSFGVLTIVGADAALGADNDEVFLAFHMRDEEAGPTAAAEIARISAVYINAEAADDGAILTFDCFLANSLTEVLRVGQNTAADATSQLLTLQGTTALPCYSEIGDPNTGMNLDGSDGIVFATGGAAELTLTTSGGTFAGTLGVDGATALTGALTVTTGAASFNTTGGDFDFSARTDAIAVYFFIDASADTCGIGGAPPTTGGNTDAVLSVIAQTTGVIIPVLRVAANDGAANADGDDVAIMFGFQDDTNTTRDQGGSIALEVVDNTSTEMDTLFNFRLMTANNAADADQIASLVDAAGTLTWTDESARALKCFDEAPLSGICDKLKTLKLGRIHGQKLQDRHDRGECLNKKHTYAIGTTAEDFYDVFGLGTNPYTGQPGIAPRNLAGVALAACKELITRVEALEAR